MSYFVFTHPFLAGIVYSGTGAVVGAGLGYVLAVSVNPHGETEAEKKWRVHSTVRDATILGILGGCMSCIASILGIRSVA